MSSFRRVIGISLSLFALSACGGGSSGGGDSGAQPPPTTPIYSVTTSVTGNGSGSISPTSSSVSQGNSTSFTISPASGSTIMSVSGCGGSLNGTTYTTGAITSSCAVTATFDLNVYTVTATAGIGGSINPASVNVSHGDTTTFTVAPSTGYQVSSVTGCNGTLVGEIYTTGSVTESCEVNANFVELTPVVKCISSAEDLTQAFSEVGFSGAREVFQIAADRLEGSFFVDVPADTSLEILGGYSPGCAIQDPAARTTLDAQGTGVVLTVLLSDATSVILQNLTIANGNDETRFGGGLYIGRPPQGAFAATAEIDNVYFVNNTSDGGGLYARVGRLKVSNSIFETNSGSSGGGADVHCTQCEFTDNSFVGNTAGSGGGLFAWTKGGALSDRKILISGNSFESNEAGSGGALVAWSNHELRVTQNQFSSNAATGFGGGVELRLEGDYSLAAPRILETSLMEVTDNFFVANNGGADRGGGAFIATYGPTLVANNLFEKNVSQDSGGALHLSLPDMEVSSAGTTVINNTFVLNQVAIAGGAVSVLQTDNTTPFKFSNNAVSQNVAPEGRNLYINNDGNGDFLPAPVLIQHSAFDGLDSIFVALGEPQGSNNLEITESAYEDFATGDYRPALGSLLIDAGVLEEDVPSTDILGNPRGMTPDIGAFER